MKVDETREKLIALVRQMAPTAMLPSERELAAEWNVARMTLRRAADELVAEGLLYREQGRGTFVHARKMQQEMGMSSFSASVIANGMTPSAETLEFKRLLSGGHMASALRVPANDPIFRFSRRLFADGVPLALDTTWVAEATVPGLRQEDLEGSWYQVLADRFGHTVMSGESRLELSRAGRREVALLDVELDSPLFKIVTTVFDRAHRVLEHSVYLLAGDRAAFEIDRLPRATFTKPRPTPLRRH